MRFEFKLKADITLDAELLANLKVCHERFVKGEATKDNTPDGIMNAFQKLPLDVDTDSELFLRTVIGENTADIIATEIPLCFPEESSCVFSVIEYKAPDPVKAPPADAAPLIVQIGDRNKVH